MEQTPEWIYVCIGGVKIRFTSDVHEELEAIENCFRYHLISASEEGAYDHEIVFRGTDSGFSEDNIPMAWEGEFKGVAHTGIERCLLRKYVCDNGRKEIYSTGSGEWFETDLQRMHTECRLKEFCIAEDGRRERSQIWALLMPLLHAVMAYHRRYSLHASAVVHNGRAILFTGRSGSGKSTLATDLAARGVGYLGDDIVFVYNHAGQVRIASLLFEAKLFESNGDEKDFVDVVERSGAEVLQDAPLGAICEIELAKEGRTEAGRADDQERLFPALIGAANNIAMIYDRDDWMNTLSAMLMGYDLQTVRFGSRLQLDTTFLESLT